MGLRIRRAGGDTLEAENALSWDAVQWNQEMGSQNAAAKLERVCGY